MAIYEKYKKYMKLTCSNNSIEVQWKFHTHNICQIILNIKLPPLRNNISPFNVFHILQPRVGRQVF